MKRICYDSRTICQFCQSLRFASTVEESFKERVVFKERARSWVTRRLIKNAIRIVSPVSSKNSGKRDVWSVAQRASGRDGEIDAVTRLTPLERFVFVMSILERHSLWDCSLLLGCSMKKVALAQTRALRRLPVLGTSFVVFEAPQSDRLQVTA